MSIFGEIPRQRWSWVGRAVAGFVLGAVVGILPALLLFAGAVRGEGVDPVRVAGMCVLVGCVPPAVVTALLAGLGGGRGLIGLLKVMGRRVSGHWWSP